MVIALSFPVILVDEALKLATRRLKAAGRDTNRLSLRELAAPLRGIEIGPLAGSKRH